MPQIWRRCSIVQAPGNGKCVLRQWSLQTWKWLGSILSKNKGTPKWMVYNGKPLLKWMIWGYHYFWKPPYLTSFCCWSVGPGTPPNKKSQRFHTLQATKYVLICVYIGRLIYIYKTFRLSLISRWWFQQIFSFHPYLGKIPILTNIFQIDWNHQTDIFFTLLLSFQWYCVFLHWGHIVLGDQHLDYLLLV